MRVSDADFNALAHRLKKARTNSKGGRVRLQRSVIATAAAVLLLLPLASAAGRSTSSATPIRAAFYYPWFPETWKVHGQLTHYAPDLGYYRTANPKVDDRHIACADLRRHERGDLVMARAGPLHRRAAREPARSNGRATLAASVGRVRRTRSRGWRTGARRGPQLHPRPPRQEPRLLAGRWQVRGLRLQRRSRLRNGGGVAARRIPRSATRRTST